MIDTLVTILVFVVPAWAIFRIEMVAARLDELDERFEPREDRR